MSEVKHTTISPRSSTHPSMAPGLAHRCTCAEPKKNPSSAMRDRFNEESRETVVTAAFITAVIIDFMLLVKLGLYLF